MARARAKLFIDIVETNQQLEKLMLIEIVKELNKRIPLRMASIDNKIRVATLGFLQTTGTYDSLVNGELAGHFGIPISGRKQRIDTILQAVTNRMEVEFVPIKLAGKNFGGGIKFRVLLKNLSEVLTLSAGVVLTEKGRTLEWLRWLLTLGDTIIIDNYSVDLKPGTGRSRGGLMVLDGAGSWRVPPQFAGTINDNWLTRAFNDNIIGFRSIIEPIIRQELQGI